MQGMVDLFNKGDERLDVAIVQPGPGIVPLELFYQPAGIINADVELIISAPEEGAREFAQFPRRRSCQPRELRATAAINQTILEVDPNLRVSPFEEALDLAEERFGHRRIDGLTSSSRLSNWSE